MLKIFLGISITLNVISVIIFFFMYKYSFKSVKNKLENYLVNNFIDEGTKDYLNGLQGGFDNDNKQSCKNNK